MGQRWWRGTLKGMCSKRWHICASKQCHGLQFIRAGNAFEGIDATNNTGHWWIVPQEHNCGPNGTLVPRVTEPSSIYGVGWSWQKKYKEIVQGLPWWPNWWAKFVKVVRQILVFSPQRNINYPSQETSEPYVGPKSLPAPSYSSVNWPGLKSGGPNPFCIPYPCPLPL